MELTKVHRRTLLNRLETVIEQIAIQKEINAKLINEKRLAEVDAPERCEDFQDQIDFTDTGIFLLQQEKTLIEECLTNNDMDY